MTTTALTSVWCIPLLPDVVFLDCKGKPVPLQAWGWGSYGSQITWEGSSVVVSLSALRMAFFTLIKYSWYSFLKRLCHSSAIVRSEGLRQRITPLTPYGIKPATFRFVAQHLNHCAIAVFIFKLYWIYSSKRNISLDYFDTETRTNVPCGRSW